SIKPNDAPRSIRFFGPPLRKFVEIWNYHIGSPIGKGEIKANTYKVHIKNDSYASTAKSKIKKATSAHLWKRMALNNSTRNTTPFTKTNTNPAR
ncbi:MAG TPA: hypothetical protein PLY76_11670, partial [Flavobacteriales bacterium]|nr:hypothetical protein [Flavobacteriales bacterium]